MKKNLINKRKLGYVDNQLFNFDFYLHNYKWNEVLNSLIIINFTRNKVLNYIFLKVFKLFYLFPL